MIAFRLSLISFLIIPAVLSKKPKAIRETFQLEAQNVNFSVANGVEWIPHTSSPTTTPWTLEEGMGPPDPSPSAVGSLFILTGTVEPGWYHYYFSNSCMILEGGVDDISEPPTLFVTQQKCDLDVCVGFDEETGDPNCFSLRFSGVLQTGIDLQTGYQTEEVSSFKAALVGGSGRYLMSQGQAIVAQDGSSINIDLFTIPNKKFRQAIIKEEEEEEEEEEWP